MNNDSVYLDSLYVDVFPFCPMCYESISKERRTHVFCCPNCRAKYHAALKRLRKRRKDVRATTEERNYANAVLTEMKEHYESTKDVPTVREVQRLRKVQRNKNHSNNVQRNKKPTLRRPTN